MPIGTATRCDEMGRCSALGVSQTIKDHRRFLLKHGGSVAGSPEILITAPLKTGYNVVPSHPLLKSGNFLRPPSVWPESPRPHVVGVKLHLPPPSCN